MQGHEQTNDQVAKITLEKSKWGDMLRVTYDPTTELAKLLPGDEIYTVYFVYFADASEKRWGKMHKDGKILKYEMSVKEDMAFLTFYFITLDDWDREATVSTMVYRRDSVPARGAYRHKMTSPFLTENYLEFFQKELEFYPDNYAAYREKWFIQGAFDTDNLTEIVKQDIAMLRKQPKDEPVDFLYSLSYGYMLLGNEPKSRNILRKMFEKYPESSYTGWAIEHYEYRVFSKQIKGKGPKQIHKMKWKLMQKYPLTQYARDKIIHTANEMEWPIASIKVICEPWMKDEPDNPMPYFSLAHAYSERIRLSTRLYRTLVGLPNSLV